MAGPARRRSTCSPRPGSPRSTCCCSPRWSAAWCRGCASTSARCVAAPPDAPTRLDRLPHTPAALPRRRSGDRGGRAAGRAAARRWRTVVREQPTARSPSRAEKGYLKETGNLLFHFALLALLVGVGARLAGTAGTATGCWSPGRTRGSATRCSSTTSTALGAAGRRGRPAAVLRAADRLPTPTYLRHRPAVVVPRPMVTVRATDGRPRTTGRSRSTTRCGWTAPTSTCSATATRRCCATPTGTARRRPTIAPFLPTRRDAHQRGRGRSSRTPTSTRRPARATRTLQVGVRGHLPADRAGPAAVRRARSFPAERDPALMLRRTGATSAWTRASPQLGLRSSTSARSRSGRLKPVGEREAAAAGRDVDAGRRHAGGVPRHPAVDHACRSGTTRASRSCSVGAVLAAGRADAVADRPAPPGLVPGHARRADGGGSLMEAGGLPRTDYPGFAEEFAGWSTRSATPRRSGRRSRVRGGRDGAPVRPAAGRRDAGVPGRDGLLRRRVRVRQPQPHRPGRRARRPASWSASARPGRPSSAVAGRRRPPATAATGRRSGRPGSARIARRAHRARPALAAPRRRWSPAASPPTGCRGATCTSSCSSVTLVGAVGLAGRARPPAGAPAPRPVRRRWRMVLLLGVAGHGALHRRSARWCRRSTRTGCVSTSSRSSLASGIFLLGFVPAALFLIRAGYDQGKRGFPYTLGARLPGGRRAGAADLPAARVRVPDLDVRASSRARSGPRRPGAGTGAGTPRRSGRSSPGWSTPATCTPGRRRASSATHRDVDRRARLGHHADQPVRSQPLLRSACTPTPAY